MSEGSADMNDVLIAAVAKRDALWNPTNHLHRNVFVLTKLWKEVGLELKKDVKTIKARWKNLRAYYYKEQQRIDRSKEDGKTYYSTWQYSEQMQFLNNAVSEKDSLLDADEDNQESESMIYEIPVKLEQKDSLATDSENDSYHGDPEPPPIKKIRLTEMDEPHKFLEIERKRLEVLERECVKRRNEDMLFFESLVPYLSNIPALRKLRLRSKIQDLILTELEALEGTSAK